MAKEHGQVNENTGKVESKRVKKIKEVPFPVTVYDTPAKRFWRKVKG